MPVNVPAPGFASGLWFDPIPGETGVLGMTLEQLADEIRRGNWNSAQWKRALAALDEILRRIDAAVGDT